MFEQLDFSKPKAPPKFIDLNEAAKLLDVPVPFIKKFIRRGALPQQTDGTIKRSHVFHLKMVILNVKPE